MVQMPEDKRRWLQTVITLPHSLPQNPKCSKSLTSRALVRLKFKIESFVRNSGFAKQSGGLHKEVSALQKLWVFCPGTFTLGIPTSASQSSD